MDSDPGRDDISQRMQSDGGTPIDRGEMEIYAAVRGAVKDALLEVTGLLLQLGVGLALVFLGVQTLLWSMSLLDAAFGVVLLITGIFVAAPVLKLVQPLRV